VHGLTHLQSYALGLASALLLFASILAHEFGHALVARRRGVRIEEIDLWLLGGVARMSGQPKTAGDEQRFALAGLP
jgi:Zn-dependent protease